ncbi:MAG: hypothetical protein AAFR04_04045 [Pseudomonadota bacterium]
MSNALYRPLSSSFAPPRARVRAVAALTVLGAMLVGCAEQVPGDEGRPLGPLGAPTTQAAPERGSPDQPPAATATRKPTTADKPTANTPADGKPKAATGPNRPARPAQSARPTPPVPAKANTANRAKPPQQNARRPLSGATKPQPGAQRQPGTKPKPSPQQQTAQPSKPKQTAQPPTQDTKARSRDRAASLPPLPPKRTARSTPRKRSGTPQPPLVVTNPALPGADAKRPRAVTKTQPTAPQRAPATVVGAPDANAARAPNNLARPTPRVAAKPVVPPVVVSTRKPQDPAVPRAKPAPPTVPPITVTRYGPPEPEPEPGPGPAPTPSVTPNDESDGAPRLRDPHAPTRRVPQSLLVKRFRKGAPQGPRKGEHHRKPGDVIRRARHAPTAFVVPRDHVAAHALPRASAIDQAAPTIMRYPGDHVAGH